MAKKTKAKVADAVPEAIGGKSEDTWRAESDARILRDAAEILDDPERLKKASAQNKKEKKKFRSVEDIISYRNRPKDEADEE